MPLGHVQQIQIPYNASDRLAERGLLSAAADHGVGVMVMRPLGAGRLARHAPPDEALAPLAPYGVRTWARALLKFMLCDGRVSRVIAATSKPHRMTDNAIAGSGPWLDEGAREYVAELIDSSQGTAVLLRTTYDDVSRLVDKPHEFPDAALSATR